MIEREKGEQERKIENRIRDDSVGLKIFGYELSTRDGEGCYLKEEEEITFRICSSR